MENKSNGKIVIAILVMFVVALSIVGVTYAYFTTTLIRNTKTESVTVDAGKLIATYTGSKNIDVENIFPGWKSDGNTYYDVNKIQDNKLAATTATTDEERAATTADKAENGLRAPVQFSVKNDSDNANSSISFIAKLTVSENGFSDDDLTAGNVVATLYKGNYTDGTDTTLAKLEGTEVAKVVLNKTDSVYNFATSAADIQTLAAKNNTANYYVVFEYKNEPDKAQASQGKTLNATVSIVGVQQNGGHWYDADNHQIF